MSTGGKFYENRISRVNNILNNTGCKLSENRINRFNKIHDPRTDAALATSQKAAVPLSATADPITDRIRGQAHTELMRPYRASHITNAENQNQVTTTDHSPSEQKEEDRKTGGKRRFQQAVKQVKQRRIFNLPKRSGAIANGSQHSTDSKEDGDRRATIVRRWTSSRSVQNTVRQASVVAGSTWHHFKNLIPSFLLLLYSLLSATILYYIEKHMEDLPFQTDKGTATCLNKTDFWAALFYVNTLYTTIGYGNVYACTSIGRLVSVVIAVIGIPLVFIVLNGTGRFLSMVMNKICVLCGAMAEMVRQRREGKLTRNALWADLTDDLDDDEPLHVPIYLGVILTLLWTMICALYFSITEDWSYFGSLYFSAISLMTIGLGDLAPEKHKLGIMTFTAIMIGLSLVSMSIKVVQAHIEHLFNQMKIDIQEHPHNTARSQTESESAGDPLSKITGADQHVAKEDAKLIEAPHRSSMGQKYLYSLFSEKQMQVLDRMYQKKVRMRIRGVQATAHMESKGTNPQIQGYFKDNKLVSAVPIMSDKVTQTESADFSGPTEGASASEENLAPRKRSTALQRVRSFTRISNLQVPNVTSKPVNR